MWLSKQAKIALASGVFVFVATTIAFPIYVAGNAIIAGCVVIAIYFK
jgi:hypothetical protein